MPFIDIIPHNSKNGTYGESESFLRMPRRRYRSWSSSAVKLVGLLMAFLGSIGGKITMCLNVGKSTCGRKQTTFQTLDVDQKYEDTS